MNRESSSINAAERSIAARLEHLRGEGSRLLKSLQAETNAELSRAGVTRREVEAEFEKIPRAIRALFPTVTARELLDGKIPASGFGLSGGKTGIGKSCAIAALLRRFVSARLKIRAESLQAGRDYPIGRAIVWRSWPLMAEHLKQCSALDQWQEIADLVSRCARTPILVLDDLGRERIRGSYSEDFATAKLDTIIDTRYQESRPTFYTTNLTADGIASAYGPASASRLMGANPLVDLSASLPDLRLHRGERLN